MTNFHGLLFFSLTMKPFAKIIFALAVFACASLHAQKISQPCAYAADGLEQLE